MKRRSFVLFSLMLLCLSGHLHAQLWSGVIDPSRAVDWSSTNPGVVGGVPSASWTQCGSTIAAYSGTAAKINNALAACSANTYVLLGAGTFNLSTGIQMVSNVVLRGSGANNTFLIFTGNNSCGGEYASICGSLDSTWTGTPYIQPGGTQAATWSGGYSQGTTSITLTSVGSSGITAGQYIYLDQANKNTDPGTLFVCDNTTLPCSLEGGAPGRTISGNHYNQVQIVKVTNVAGSTYTITPGLYGINWASGQTPGAWWPTTQIHNFGIENLSMDSTQNGAYSAVTFQNAFNGWVSGVRSVYLIGGCTGSCTTQGRNHIWLDQAAHITVQNSYFYGTVRTASLSYGVESFIASDNLIQNNIFQYIAAPIMMGPNTGSVLAYNFSINDFINLPTYLSEQDDQHDAGVLYNLFEGNIGAMFYGDVFHGTGGANTFFRNRWNGNECTGGTCNTGGNYPVRLDSYNRVENTIGNVLGTTGVHTTYQIVSPTGGAYGVYYLNHGNTEGSVTVPTDSLVGTTLMRWGNYDTVTADTRWCGNSSNTGWSTTCGGTSEIPTKLSSYSNAVPTKGDTGAGQSVMPASFFYNSTPSWWPSGKPWPAIGPDVSSGNLGVCSGGSYPYNMATTSSQCTGGSFTSSAAGGHANSNPAMDCYLGTMGGPPDGTASVLTFDASSCYVSSGGSGGSPPPTGLVVLVH
jgi:hypothetical protein